MRPAKGSIRVLGLTLVACCLFLPARAEDVEKKFRIGLGVGFLNAQNSVSSDSANTLTLVDAGLEPVDFYRDPRNDSGAFGNLDINSGALGTVFGQYAVNKIFLIELSVGYQKTDLGDIEVQAQFQGIEIPDLERFRFEIFRLDAGEVEQVPLQLSFLTRFRPRASFNPYIGGGFGYTFIGFEPSDEFNDLSVNMDASQGSHWTVNSAFFGNEALIPSADPLHDLDGARVDIRDTWEWHAIGGVEISFKRKWVAFVDLRYSVSSRKAQISFDGTDDLGVGVPNLTDFCSNPPGSFPPGGDFFTVCPRSEAGNAALAGAYGPTRILIGGLVDGGSLQPDDDAPPNTDCSDPTQARFCTFLPMLDGEVDPGFYYAQGGSFKYDYFSLLVGVRYTF